MIKDIQIPTVVHVTIAVARKKPIGESEEWLVADKESRTGNNKRPPFFVITYKRFNPRALH